MSAVCSFLSSISKLSPFPSSQITVTFQSAWFSDLSFSNFVSVWDAFPLRPVQSTWCGANFSVATALLLRTWGWVCCPTTPHRSPARAAWASCDPPCPPRERGWGRRAGRCRVRPAPPQSSQDPQGTPCGQSPQPRSCSPGASTVGGDEPVPFYTVWWGWRGV